MCLAWHHAARWRVREAMLGSSGALRGSCARLRLAATLGRAPTLGFSLGSSRRNAAAAAAASSLARLSRPRVGVGGPPNSTSLLSLGLGWSTAAPASPASASTATADTAAASAAACAAAWRPLRLPCKRARKR